jgi:hypothetical protein
MKRTPKELFYAAVAALAAEDWFGLAGLCDSDSLERFKTGMIHLYTRETPTISVDDYLRHRPDMPREVAEYYISLAKTADPRVRLREELPSVKSMDDLHSLSAREVYAAWLHARSPRGQLQRQVEAGQAPAEAIEVMIHADRSESFRFVGVVMERDRLAHVLYRWTATQEEAREVDGTNEKMEGPRSENEGLVAPPPSILTCKRNQSGEWHLHADYSLFEFGSIMYHVGEPEVNGDAV